MLYCHKKVFLENKNLKYVANKYMKTSAGIQRKCKFKNKIQFFTLWIGKGSVSFSWLSPQNLSGWTQFALRPCVAFG